MNRLIERFYNYARKQTDNAVSKAISDEEEILWSGRPGYVATFNMREVLGAIPVIAIISIVVGILFNTEQLPVDFFIIVTASGLFILLLFIAWLRQIYRYIKTINLFYAVTKTRIVIVKGRDVIREMPHESVENTAVTKKFFGNGSVVFNGGGDYFTKGNVIEAPTDKVFVFFNVMDVDGVLKNIKNYQELY
ncbi:MAG: hypothetical protein FWD34_07620 [Oscillospiraceae bacterium]|nr:hypothetical protein [Oscillospiraceae bacterium]